MEVNDYVTIASQFMFFGASIGCIVILIGYLIFNVFELFEEGGN